MEKHSKIFVTGYRGMVGSAVTRELRKQAYENVRGLSRGWLDLRDWRQVRKYFSEQRPDYVIACAAKVGGIVGNAKQPVDFFLDNIRIETNILEAAHLFGVKKLLFLGSACAYPKLAAVPVREDSLLTGALEPSNEMYALAKIAGVKLCDAYRKQHGCNFISCMPTNLYGVGDTYHPEDSHVIPGMIRRFHEARKESRVTLWGTGNPVREFLFVDDLARACLVLMEQYDKPGPVNIGSNPIPLSRLAAWIAETVGFHGRIVWDQSRPDGTPDRTMDSSTIRNLGWTPEIDLPTGLAAVYNDFLCRKLS